MIQRSEEKVFPMASAKEQDQIDRFMLAWANTFPDSPVPFIKSFMDINAPAMTIQTIQSPKIIKKYIMGGYQGEYQFSARYRIKPGNSEAARMDALELLNNFGDWSTTQYPDIGEGLRVIKIEPTTRAALLAAYEDNDEDYQILMKMTYERV